jgi:hypothetical protein
MEDYSEARKMARVRDERMAKGGYRAAYGDGYPFGFFMWASCRLITDIDATFGQHFFYVSEAQCEPEIEPNAVANDVWWKTMPLKRNWPQLITPLSRAKPRKPS